jgi:hypothetical protein
MKKICFSLIICFFTNTLLAQDLIYTVSGEHNKNKIPLDSILVENLTNKTWITFNNLPQHEYYQLNLTKKEFWGTVDIKQLDINSGFVVAQNIPGQIIFSYLEEIPTKATFSVFGVSGQRILTKDFSRIFPGNSFLLSIGATGVYIVRIDANQKSQSFKVTGSPTPTSTTIDLLGGNFIDKSTKSAQNSTVGNGFDFKLGDSIRVTVFKNDLFSPSVKRSVKGSDKIDFSFLTNQDTNSVVTTGKINFDLFPQLDISVLTVQSIDKTTEVKINGTYQITNQEDDSTELPLLFVKGDNVLFGAIDAGKENESVSIDEILLFYYMLFPDIAYSGMKQPDLIKLMIADTNYSQLTNLITSEINNNRPLTENSQFITLMQNSAVAIAAANSDSLKSAVTDIMHPLRFTFDRLGKITWDLKGPVFCSLGLEIQNSSGIPINNEPFLIDPSKWIFSPVSGVTWILDNYFFKTSTISSINLVNDGQYKIVFTNGNKKGLASDKLYNEVRSNNNKTFITDVIFFVVPVALKGFFNECGRSIFEQFESEINLFKAFVIDGCTPYEAKDKLYDLCKNYVIIYLLYTLFS